MDDRSMAFDVTGPRYIAVDVEESVFALKVPDRWPNTFSVLVWGIVIRDARQIEMKTPAFLERPRPEVVDQFPRELYLSGWAKLTFWKVVGVEFWVAPFVPRLDGTSTFFTEPGKVETLEQSWLTESCDPKIEYPVGCPLEHPYGNANLSVYSEGPVTLHVKPQEFVTRRDYLADRSRYGFDRFRARQFEEWANA